MAKKFLYCPECNQPLQDEELKNYLSAEKLKEIDEFHLKAFMNQNQNLVTCPCGNVMEVQPGQVDYNAKDDQGQIVSPAAAIHMAEHRVKCRACDQSFCTGCRAQPYHAGKNCAEFKRHAEARKCRFCGNELANQQEEAKGEDPFEDVCLRQECINMKNATCQKKLACGHPCRGFYGE